MTYGLSPVQLAPHPPNLPPSSAGGLRVNRQPRTNLMAFEIERAAQVAKTQPHIYESTMIPLIHPIEFDDALSQPLPPSHDELLRGLCPPSATMLAYKLAPRTGDIPLQKSELPIAAPVPITQHMSEPFLTGNFSAVY